MSKTFEEIWCHKEIMGSENANALWRAGQKIAQEADAALAAKDAEVTKLREELEEASKVIDLFAQVPPSERRTLAAICDSPHPDDAIYGYRYFGMMRAARAFVARKEAK